MKEMGGSNTTILGVVESIETDGISDSLVVVVPRELDGATTVLLAGCARDAGRSVCSKWPC